MKKSEENLKKAPERIRAEQLPSLERSALTLILNKPELADTYDIEGEHFTSAVLRVIFEAAKEVGREHGTISLPLLRNQIGSPEINDQIKEFWEEAKDPFNVDMPSADYFMGEICRALRERKIDKVLTDYQLGLISPGDLPNQIALVSYDATVKKEARSKTMKELVFEYYEYMMNPETAAKIKSGFSDLDKLLVGGFAKQELSIVAARPSVGKTATTLNIATNIAKETASKRRGAVGYFSGETGFDGLMHRVIASETNVDMNRLQTPENIKVDIDAHERFHNKAQELSEMPISVHQSGGWDVFEIRRQIIEDMRLHGEEDYVAIIDHIGKIKKHTNYSRDDLNVGQITFELKKIAIELNIHIMLLSQLNRNTESRQDKRPTLADLRNSGDLEQDADVVIFLYRDDYYDKEAEDANTIELILAKSRNSATGQLKLAFRKEFQKIVQLHYDGRATSN